MSAVTIERLGHRGDGIAPGPVYAARTLPGEVVDGPREGNRITEPRILHPSAERVRAPCPHYRACGGCALQHARDDFVAEWKSQVISSSLAAQGLEAPMRPIVTSPPASRRRAVLSALRTRSGVQLGFLAARSETVAHVPDCLLVTPAIRERFPALSEIVRLGGARGRVLRLTVLDLEGGLDVAVEGGKPLDARLAEELAAVARAGGVARLTWAGELVAQVVHPTLQFGKARVALPPGAFVQATAEGEGALVGAMREAIGGASRVADLFAGAGTLSFPAAETAAVSAFESHPGLIEALEDGARHTQGLRLIKAHRRDLFRNPLVADELGGFEAVVLDPPRAGAQAQVAEIGRARVPVIAMLSCNPVTFARDSAALGHQGYQLDWVQPIDQFRWSSHVELAARLSLASGKSA